MKGRQPKHSDPAKKAAIAERQLRVLDLKKAGKSFHDIGTEMGVSAMQAHRDLKAALGELQKMTLDRAREWRQLELEKLDRLEEKLSLRIQVESEDGDLKAIDRLLRIAERRSKLLGLDAPERHEYTEVQKRPQDMTREELVQAAREILQKRSVPASVNGNGISH